VEDKPHWYARVSGVYSDVAPASHPTSVPPQVLVCELTRFVTHALPCIVNSSQIALDVVRSGAVSVAPMPLVQATASDLHLRSLDSWKLLSSFADCDKSVR
jgi:hypothetical protein